MLDSVDPWQCGWAGKTPLDRKLMAIGDGL
jgi:hypothetical protein